MRRYKSYRYSTINARCKTHVQSIFEGGIFEAYQKARVNYPFDRLKLYGVAKKEIKHRSKKYEEEIATKLSGYGTVNRLVKTKRGFADVILERKNKKAIIEIKDYRAKEISITQIKQLNRYLEDCCCQLGVLVCPKKPKKDAFTFGKNRIFIIESSHLHEIPSLMEINGEGL